MNGTTPFNPLSSFKSAIQPAPRDIENSDNPVKIAILPFQGNADDEKISGALQEVLLNGNEQDKDQMCLALLTSCQNMNLPAATRECARSFLSQLLESVLGEMVVTENLRSYENTGQLITQLLPKLINIKLEQMELNNSSDIYAERGYTESNIDNKTVIAELKEIAKKEIAFKYEAYNICLAQTSTFAFDFDDSIETRIELAQRWLKEDKRGVGFIRGHFNNEVLKAVIVLESFSKLDHPRTSEAKKLLDTWLTSPKNRLWLINQYGILLASYHSENNTFKEYKNNFEKHIRSLLQQVHTFKEQGEADKAQQLVYQLIDAAIELEYVDRGDVLKACSSFFYQLLLASPDIDEACKNELEIRQKIGKINVTANNIPDCLIAAANTPGRPNAAYQVARIYVPYPYVDGKLDTTPEKTSRKWNDDHFKDFIIERRVTPIASLETADSIQKAIHYFQIAANDGCLLLKRESSALYDVIKANTEQAQRCMAKGELSWVKSDFEKSARAGDVTARIEFLKLSDPKMENKDVQFELGQLYLAGSKAPYFIKQDIPEAQKRLEFAAENGHVEAAILVAQHYSTLTLLDQPKFKSTDFFPKDPNTKAMEFLELAFKNSFKNDLQIIYENGIPNKLKEVVKKLGPDAMAKVFDLSEEYESIFTPWKNDPKLASVLLKFAAEGKNQNALAKIQSLESQLEQELKIKVELMMKEEAKLADMNITLGKQEEVTSHSVQNMGTNMTGEKNKVLEVEYTLEEKRNASFKSSFDRNTDFYDKK